MANRHLTEIELQQHLDGDLDCRYPLRTAHLNTCQRCQQEVSKYRNLYSSLAMAEPPPLNKNFAAKVCAEAFRRALQERNQRLTNIGLMALSGLVLIMVSWYYLDMVTIWQSMSGMNRNMLVFVESMFTSASKIAAESGPRLHLIGISVAVLMVMGVVDSVLRNARGKTITLSL